MDNPAAFSRILHSWSEIFMRRSIHDLIRFSKETGLSMPQMSALFHMHHGNECGVSNIGEHLGVTNAAASQMVDRLVQSGIVERTEDPEDRRVKQLKLTEKGTSIVQQGIALRRRWIEDLTKILTYEEQEAISSALVMLTNAAEKLDTSNEHFPSNHSNNSLN
jgi:DNA-binding MarR family transcriptional regulator